MLQPVGSHLLEPILKRLVAQKSIEPSPLRPQTTMAIENVKTAANAAQANVNNMVQSSSIKTMCAESVRRVSRDREL